MKNLVILTNLADVGNRAHFVSNFSDTNVKDVISKELHIHSDNLQCLSSSGNGGIYKIKSNTEVWRKALLPIDGLEGVLIELQYAKLVTD